MNDEQKLIRFFYMGKVLEFCRTENSHLKLISGIIYYLLYNSFTKIF